MPIFRIAGQHRRIFAGIFLLFVIWFQIKRMCFRIASEKLFRIASDLGVCDSNRIAHRGGIARFGPLRSQTNMCYNVIFGKLIPENYVYVTCNFSGGWFQKQTLRAKGTLISEPRFPTPCDTRFFPTRHRENGHFEANPLKMAIFRVLRGRNRMSHGVEDRGRLISVPLALREKCTYHSISTSLHF